MAHVLTSAESIRAAVKRTKTIVIRACPQINRRSKVSVWRRCVEVRAVEEPARGRRFPSNLWVIQLFNSRAHSTRPGYPTTTTKKGACREERPVADVGVRIYGLGRCEEHRMGLSDQLEHDETLV